VQSREICYSVVKLEKGIGGSMMRQKCCVCEKANENGGEMKRTRIESTSAGCVRTQPRTAFRTPAPSLLRGKVAPNRRSELAPSFYKDIRSFRKAVADGSVDVSKACHDMNEYKWSLDHV